MRKSTFALTSMLLIAGASSAWAAASEADFKAAYTVAEAADKQAAALRNQWTTTAAALAAARKAADAGDFERAAALSKEAEALARASIFQAESEKDAWESARNSLDHDPIRLNWITISSFV